MDEKKYGVHQGHCCVKHGCKYGDKDCPVVARKVVQSYTCEDCDMDGIESVEELLLKVKGEVQGTLKIEVIMEPDEEMAQEGTPYFWCVLQYNNVWHNVRSGWSKTPKGAFADALWQYELIIGDEK